MSENKKDRLYKAAAVGSALIVWQIAAMILNHAILLASPISVFTRLVEVIFEEGFLAHIWFSLYRIGKGFLLGLVLGTVLAVVAGRFPAVETLIFPYMVTIKTVPVASFIVIALIWLSSKELSVFISFLIVLPVIYNNILAGLKSIDPKMQEMAEVFRMSWSKRLLYIYIPHLKSFIISACSVAIGLAWKSGVAAEIIGIPDGSLGEVLYEAKVYLNTTDLLAWTVVIVFVSVLFEKVFMYLLRKSFEYHENRNIDGGII
ncbi:MAG: ABC transporter permease subunit [Anaerofustis stercorihominis]|nr:ABC transporter permease subunit [Anaerofustis stercorihominis]